jgi:hypothetical protein
VQNPCLCTKLCSGNAIFAPEFAIRKQPELCFSSQIIHLIRQIEILTSFPKEQSPPPSSRLLIISCMSIVKTKCKLSNQCGGAEHMGILVQCSYRQSYYHAGQLCDLASTQSIFLARQSRTLHFSQTGNDVLERRLLPVTVVSLHFNDDTGPVTLVLYYGRHTSLAKFGCGGRGEVRR